MKLLRDLWLLVKCYPVARRIVKELNEESYAGVVKTQIAYQKLRTALVREKGCIDTELTGSICYIAVSIAAYRHAK
jgi:hypothetical protein